MYWFVSYLLWLRPVVSMRQTEALASVEFAVLFLLPMYLADLVAPVVTTTTTTIKE